MNVRTGRPTTSESALIDEQIRAAAIDQFVLHGFDATTMEAVAKAAGVTKRTLYAKFADKVALFTTVVPWAIARKATLDAMPDLTAMPLADALTYIGRAAIARAVDAEWVGVMQLAQREARRFPQFQVAADSLTWSPRLRAVRDLLDHHRAIGQVEVDDLDLASEQFLAMVSTIPGRLAEFGIRRSDADEARHLRHAVQLFVRALEPRR